MEKAARVAAWQQRCERALEEFALLVAGSEDWVRLIGNQKADERAKEAVHHLTPLPRQGSPPAPDSSGQQEGLLEGIINSLERSTGVDLDGDGDVGLPGRGDGVHLA